jgi:acyl carrier protein
MMNLHELIAAVLDVEPEKVNAETERVDLEVWDSLAQLSIVSALEETYSVMFTSSEMQQLASVPFIRSALASKGVEA